MAGRSITRPLSMRLGSVALGPSGMLRPPSRTGGVLLVVICLALLSSGCAKKVTRSDGFFDLSGLFRRDHVSPEPTVPESPKERGVRLAKEKRLDEAVKAFKLHVEENPEDHYGFNAIAVCYKQMGDPHKAMDNFQRALEFAESAEEKAKVLANIGNLYFAAKKHQAALGYYKEAAAEYEGNPLYLILIARTFIVLDEFDRARKVLDEAERISETTTANGGDQDRGSAYYLLATCYAALGEEEKAFKYTELALKADPDAFVKRLEKDLADEASLFYTLKGDPKMKRLLDTYHAALSPLFGLFRERRPRGAPSVE